MSEQEKLGGFEIFTKSLSEAWENLSGNKWNILKPLSIPIIVCAIGLLIPFILFAPQSALNPGVHNVSGYPETVHHSLMMKHPVGFIIYVILVTILFSPFIIKAFRNCLDITRQKTIVNNIGFENYKKIGVIFAYTVVSLIVFLPPFWAKEIYMQNNFQYGVGVLLMVPVLSFLYHFLLALSVVRVVDGEKNPIKAVIFSIKNLLSLRPAIFCFIAISFCVFIFFILCVAILGVVFALFSLIPIKILSFLLMLIVSLIILVFLLLYLLPFLLLIHAQFYENILKYHDVNSRIN